MAGHTIYPVKLDTTIIKGITESDLPHNINIRGEINSGSVYAEKKSIAGFAPVHTFSTMDIAAMLNKLGIPTTFWWKIGLGYFVYAYAMDSGGTRLGSTAHKQFNMARGIVIPQRLSVSHGSDAVLSCLAVFTWDGSTEVYVTTESITLPSAIGDKIAYRMGPVTIGNGTLNFVMNKLTSLDIDFGIQLDLEHTGSDQRPRDVSIMQIDPKITIRSADQQVLHLTTGIPPTGLKLLNANTKLFLRKRDPDGGTDVADGTAEHIKLVTQGVAVITNGHAGRRGERAEVEMLIEPYHDGTNIPLVFSTAIAIT